MAIGRRAYLLALTLMAGVLQERRMARRTLHPAALLIVAAVTVACSLVALIALSEQKAEAAFPGKNGKIAFFRSPDDVKRTDLFVVNPDGSGLQNITNSVKVDESYPSWSADGTKLVYARKHSYNPPVYEIATLNLTSGSERIVTETPFFEFSRPSWSPDGTKIAFSRSGNDGTRVWTMKADGSNKKKLTSATPDGPGADTDPDWSPDGTEIVFSRYKARDDSTDLYAVRPDGTGLRQITKTLNTQEYDPAFSPDSNRIAYNRVGPQENDIWKVSASGGDGVPVTDTPLVWEDAPSWQPIP